MKAEACAGLALLALAASACAAAPSQAPPPVPAGEAGEPIDAFDLAIAAGRWSVLIERSREGLYRRPFDPAAPDEDDRLRIDASLKTSALAMLALRAELCRFGEGGPEPCAPLTVPGWVVEPPSAGLSLEELEARNDWVGEQTFRFIGAGCEIGRRESGDDLFCSVE